MLDGIRYARRLSLRSAYSVVSVTISEPQLSHEFTSAKHAVYMASKRDRILDPPTSDTSCGSMPGGCYSNVVKIG